MSTGNLSIVSVAKRLVSVTTSKGLQAAIKVGRFIKEISFVNNAAFTDSHAVTVGKTLTNSANFAGEPVLVPARLLANSANFAGEPTFGTTKILANAFGTSDSGVILSQDYGGPDYFDQDHVGTQTTF